VRRNDCVVNNRLMSIDGPTDRPKPANTNTFMRKCYKQRCATKTAKDTYDLCSVMLVVIRLIKV